MIASFKTRVHIFYNFFYKLFIVYFFKYGLRTNLCLLQSHVKVHKKYFIFSATYFIFCECEESKQYVLVLPYWHVESEGGINHQQDALSLRTIVCVANRAAALSDINIYSILYTMCIKVISQTYRLGVY